MSSFIAAAPVPTPPQPGGTIDNDGFFPNIDIDQAYAAMRLDGTVTLERMRSALVEAVLTVNTDLAAWKATQQSIGFASLVDVPAPKVDGKSAHLHRYLRAIHCNAAAWLTERYRTLDATATGDRRAEAENLGVDDLRRDAHWAINDIIGAPRVTVELI